MGSGDVSRDNKLDSEFAISNSEAIFIDEIGLKKP